MVPQTVSKHAGPAKKTKSDDKKLVEKIKKKKIPSFFPLRLEVVHCLHTQAELAVLETESSTINTWWSFLGKECFAVAVDVAVAARARVVVELADPAQLVAAGARDGDKQGEDEAVHPYVDMDVDLVDDGLGLLLELGGRAVAVRVLPGLLFVLRSSHGGTALRCADLFPCEKKTSL